MIFSCPIDRRLTAALSDAAPLPMISVFILTILTEKLLICIISLSIGYKLFQFFTIDLPVADNTAAGTEIPYQPGTTRTGDAGF